MTRSRSDVAERRTSTPEACPTRRSSQVTGDRSVFNGRVSDSRLRSMRWSGGALRVLGRALLFVDIGGRPGGRRGLEDLIEDIGATARHRARGGRLPGRLGRRRPQRRYDEQRWSRRRSPTWSPRSGPQHPDLAVVGIDIPIGLPDTAPRAGGPARPAAAPGRSQVVGLPRPDPGRAPRRRTHVEASAANREATGRRPEHPGVPPGPEDPGGRRLRPLAAVVPDRRGAPGGQLRGDGRRPASSRPSGPRPGGQSREPALRAAGIEPPSYVRGQGYAADDLLDACAAAWTAARVAARGRRDPPRPARDVLRRPPGRDLGLSSWESADRNWSPSSAGSADGYSIRDYPAGDPRFREGAAAA